MKPGSRRALVGVLSVGAVLFPAAGIAYLGAVSYRADRGIVAAKIEEQVRIAWQVAQAAEAGLGESLHGAAAAFALAPEGVLTAPARRELTEAHPLARYPFRIAEGRLASPVPDPLRRDGDQGGLPLALEPMQRTCPERAFARCIREIMAQRRRQRQLDEARQRELSGCIVEGGVCRASPRALAEARRSYRALTRHDDTAPAALLALARLERAAGARAAAIQRYRELEERFGGRFDGAGIPYAVLAELGRAETAGDARALLDFYRRLVERRFSAPGAALTAIGKRVAAAIAELALTGDEARELELLEGLLEAAQLDARFAAILEPEVDDIWRTAGEQPRGRPAFLEPERTLVFRRQEDGSVIGLLLERRALDELIAGVGADRLPRGKGARAVVQRLGSPRAYRDSTRTLATASFGPLLPHFNLALVLDADVGDPLDQIVTRRGQRHLAITGGLVLLLVIGLVATVRGAARERELARLKSDFVSTVSHELKTPLTSIRMFAEMLEQGVAGADRERESRYHRIIVKESERLGLLIANLLDYSQIERGTRRYTRRREPVGEIAAEAAETFRRLREGEHHEVVLRVEPAAGDAVVLADREVVVQALLNLLANAAKYGGAGEPIELLLSVRPDDRVALAVRDRGPGIPPAEHSRIFREFYRAPAAYSSGAEGTGLGLALVKRHIEAHGGVVELDSAVGKGATFSILLPKVEE